MKTQLIILTLAAAALVGAPFTAVAQHGPGDCDGTGPHGPGGYGAFGGPGGAGGPAGHGLLGMLPRFAERLELSDGQRAQIEAVVEARKPALESLRDQAVAAREAFHDSYGIGDYDEAAYRAFFEGQAQLHVQMQLISAGAVAQVWTVLTPEQQSELLDLLELFRDGRGGPRHGGGKRLGPN